MIDLSKYPPGTVFEHGTPEYDKIVLSGAAGPMSTFEFVRIQRQELKRLHEDTH